MRKIIINLIIIFVSSLSFSQTCTESNLEIIYQGGNITMDAYKDWIYPLSYKWYKNGEEMTQDTSSKLTFQNVDLTHNGYYTCERKCGTWGGPEVVCFNVIINTLDSGSLEQELIPTDLIIDFTDKDQSQIQSLIDTLTKYNFEKTDSCMCNDPIELWTSSTPHTIDNEETVKKAKTAIDQEGVGLNYFVDIPSPQYCLEADQFSWGRLDQIVTPNSDPVKIAVIDDGFDEGAINAQGKIWQNPDLLDPFDSVSCFPPQPSGFNAACPDSPISPKKHGTAVADIITSFAPANAPIQLMNIQVKKKPKRNNIFQVVCGLRYAIDSGADIINISMGYYGPKSSMLEQAMKKAKDSSILVVTSAGNGGRGKNNHWPSGFSKIPYFDNVISVGAIDHSGIRKDFSSDADIYAPGHNLRCTTSFNETSPKSGTSFSTSFVTATGAKIKSETDKTPSEIIEDLLIKYCKPGNTDVNHELIVNLINEGSQSLIGDISIYNVTEDEAEFDARNLISGKGIIDSTSSTIFRSGNQIRLEPNFQAKSGSYFLATINDCNETPEARIAQEMNNDFKELKLENLLEEKIPIVEESGLSIQPNPFTRKTTIKFSIVELSNITLSIFNGLGQLVTVLENGEREAGDFTVSFVANKLPAGVYFVVLNDGHEIKTQKIILNR